jgi:hypothetical protein
MLLGQSRAAFIKFSERHDNDSYSGKHNSTYFPFTRTKDLITNLVLPYAAEDISKIVLVQATYTRFDEMDQPIPSSKKYIPLGQYEIQENYQNIAIAEPYFPSSLLVLHEFGVFVYFSNQIAPKLYSNRYNIVGYLCDQTTRQKYLSPSSVEVYRFLTKEPIDFVVEEYSIKII